MTKLSFEETLIEVWRQALVENAKAVKVGGVTVARIVIVVVKS